MCDLQGNLKTDLSPFSITDRQLFHNGIFYVLLGIREEILQLCYDNRNAGQEEVFKTAMGIDRVLAVKGKSRSQGPYFMLPYLSMGHGSLINLI